MRTMLVFVGGALMGCSPPLDSLSLEFEAAPLERLEPREWSVSRLEAGDYLLSLRGAVRTAPPCDALEAALLRTGRDFTLRIRRTEAPRPGAAERGCGYTAAIRGLPPGDYGLRVVHSGLSAGSAVEVAMDVPVHVR